MLKKYFPDLYVSSIEDIDLAVLKENNIHALLLDIDNTLVPEKMKDADKRAIEWIEKVKKDGFKICILSNASKKRVERFNKRLGLLAIHKAAKPDKKAFLKAARELDVTAGQTAIIGDQVFTDIIGGKKAGMYTILVKPIANKELLLIKVRRLAEKVVLSSYKKHQSNQK